MLTGDLIKMDNGTGTLFTISLKGWEKQEGRLFSVSGRFP